MLSLKRLYSFKPFLVQKVKSSSTTTIVSGNGRAKTKKGITTRNSSIPSLDVWVSLTVAAGITVVFYDAHRQGIAPLQNQQHGDEYWYSCHHQQKSYPSSTSPRPTTPRTGSTRKGYANRPNYSIEPRRSFNDRLPLNQQQCQQLSRDGYIVIDNFLSTQELQHALQSVRNIEARSSPSASSSSMQQGTQKKESGHSNTMFGPSANQREEDSKNRDKVRTDQVCFVSRGTSSSKQTTNDRSGLTNEKKKDEEEEEEEELGLRVVQQLLGGIAHAVTQSNFEGFHDDDDMSNHESLLDKGDLYKPKNIYNSITTNRKWIGVPDSMQVSLYDIQLPKDKATTTTMAALQDDQSSINRATTMNKKDEVVRIGLSTNDDSDDYGGTYNTSDTIIKDNENDDGQRREGGSGGDYYLPHLDGCHDSWLQMGLLGYLRSKYLRSRYLTCIVYLNDTTPSLGDPHNNDIIMDNKHNDDGHNSCTEHTSNKKNIILNKNDIHPKEWDIDRDGGSLRLYTNTTRGDGETASTTTKNLPGHRKEDKIATTALSPSTPTPPSDDFLDVIPQGGRLVIFSSQHVLHAVLPTFRKRIACTIWLTLNDSPSPPPTNK